VLPNVPTIAEAGIPDYNHTIWIGVMARRPARRNPIVETLNREINKILSRPEIKESWRRQGTNTMVMTPEGIRPLYRGRDRALGKAHQSQQYRRQLKGRNQ
jgi:tripartite-type tricarboxylate transporter receptor subunit TctC